MSASVRFGCELDDLLAAETGETALWVATTKVSKSSSILTVVQRFVPLVNRAGGVGPPVGRQFKKQGFIDKHKLYPISLAAFRARCGMESAVYSVFQCGLTGAILRHCLCRRQLAFEFSGSEDN